MTDELAFATVACGPSESRLFVIFCELAVAPIDGKKEYEAHATAQTFVLSDGETVVRLARCKSLGEVDGGVVMITNRSIYLLWPK